MMRVRVGNDFGDFDAAAAFSLPSALAQRELLNPGVEPVARPLSLRIEVDVTVVDYVPRAIHRARVRAEDAGASVRFPVADLTRLGELRLGASLDLVSDNKCFHGLPGVRPAAYVAVGEPALPGEGSLSLPWTQARRAEHVAFRLASSKLRYDACSGKPSRWRGIRQAAAASFRQPPTR